MKAKVGSTLFNHFGWIHLFSILTIWTVPTAIIAVRKGNIKSHKRKMILLYVGAIVIAGAFTLMPVRYLHRGALMADGHVSGHNLICGLHGWDYRIDTGVSEYNNEERLHKFTSSVQDGNVYVDADEIDEYVKINP